MLASHEQIFLQQNRELCLFVAVYSRVYLSMTFRGALLPGRILLLHFCPAIPQQRGKHDVVHHVPLPSLESGPMRWITVVWSAKCSCRTRFHHKMKRDKQSCGAAEEAFLALHLSN